MNFEMGFSFATDWFWTHMALILSGVFAWVIGIVFTLGLNHKSLESSPFDWGWIVWLTTIFWPLSFTWWMILLIYTLTAPFWPRLWKVIMKIQPFTHIYNAGIWVADYVDGFFSSVKKETDE